MNLMINRGSADTCLSPFVEAGAANVFDPDGDFIYKLMIAEQLSTGEDFDEETFLSYARNLYDPRIGSTIILTEGLPAPEENTTEPGYIYLYGTAREFRKTHASHAIVVRLRTRDEPAKTILIEVFPRQVGYGLDIDDRHDRGRAYLLAMPSSVKGELDVVTDCIQGDFLKYVSY